MVSLSVRQGEVESGLRYLNPEKDLKEVSDLLAEAFADQGDEHLQRVLRQMRLLARLSPWLGAWVFGPGVYGVNIVGFVWVEEGRVVGHAMVQRLDLEGVRWQIANVAVRRTHRGRGIGRALMEATLEHISQQGGLWALLQVRKDNPPAVHLYRSLGFETVGGEIHWKRALTSGNELRGVRKHLDLRPLTYHDQAHIRDLEVRAMSEEERWWRQGVWRRIPEDVGLMPWLFHLLGVRFHGRWGLWEERRLAAMLDIRGDKRRQHGTLHILVDRHYWGRWEETLIAEALHVLKRVGVKQVSITTEANYPELAEALQRAGFQVAFHLLNMRRKMA